MRRYLVPLVALAAVAVLGGLAGAGLLAAFDDNGGSSTTAAAPAPAQTVTVREAARTSTSGLTINQIYRRSSPGVVQIRVHQTSGGPFGQSADVTGSGFVIDRTGHILTNEHVVGGADTATVVFASGRQVSARVVGADASTDIAVLQLSNRSASLTPLPLGTASSLEIGDPVVAIGSPFGLQGTVTSGIVSALHRELQAPNGFAIEGAIQTDAALNSGNSGGPLLDDEGRVVGLNSQIQSESGGNVGIGYAVPIDTARRIAQQLIGTGKVVHAYLGVQLPASVSAGAPGSARIESVVPGGPADKAGLQAGDRVVKADGKRVVSGSDLRAAVDARRPGETLTLQIVHDGKTKTVHVKLARRPASVS